MKNLCFLLLMLFGLTSCYSVVVKDNDPSYHFYNMLKDKSPQEILTFVKGKYQSTQKKILNSNDNPYGLPSLCLAVIENRTDLIPDFIKLGANVNAQGLNGSTVLHLASQLKKNDVVQSLIEDNNALLLKDKQNRNALHYASSTNDNTVIPLLLKHFKSNVNDQDSLGNTALLYATKANNIYNIKALLAAGANPQIKNHAGENPVSYAVSMNYENILPLFGKPSPSYPKSTKKLGKKRKY